MQYVADVLHSINERVGGGPGIDLEPLGHEWLNDLGAVAEWEKAQGEEQKAAEEARREAAQMAAYQQAL